MRSWSEEGYGYPLLTADNLPNVIEFIIKNDTKKYTPEQIEEMRECDDEFDLEEYTDDPIPWVVAKIINNLENTTVFEGYLSCGDTDVDCHIGAGTIWPWTGQEKYISKEKVDEILAKYAKMLNIPHTPDFFSLEYYG